MIDEKKAFDLLMEAAPDVAEKIREYVAKEIRLYAAAVLAAQPEARTATRWIRMRCCGRTRSSRRWSTLTEPGRSDARRSAA
ncbi:MAG: hypothetical protein II008_18940 [Oscillospiraceae bacterium]|nr:hypothetical protein [Oscillospiraceae bacterium]